MRKFYKKIYSGIVLLLFGTFCTYGQVGKQIPLNPKAIPQFVDPLPHFAGQRLDARAGGSMTVTMKPTQQISVSTGTRLLGGIVTPGGNIGMANLWAYELQYGEETRPVYWPAFTIEAQRDAPLNVTYVNALGDQNYESIGLIVDQTLHWADPLMDHHSMSPYTGEPPATVHLHGGEVPPLSDGGPDSWFTPGLTPITGHSYNPDPYEYPNTQEAATLWFHDHALGVTRLNVYAGLAGFYFLRGPDEETAKLPGWSGDDLVQEAAGGFAGTRPYLPEIEVVIQDRMFDMNGQLYFPSLGINPEHPYWVPEFLGDIITVNGKTWPYLSVAPRKYRFRLLNGSNARFYELWLQNLVTGVMGPIIYQVGTDGGLLDAPVPIDPNLGGKLVIGPGERADIVIDFSANPGAVWTLRNSGRSPYPKGPPPNGMTVGRIMQFVVNGTMVDGPDADNTFSDNSSLSLPLRTDPLVKLTDNWTTTANPVIPGPIKVRQLTLNEVMGMGGPLEALVNNTKWSGHSVAPEITDPVEQQDYTAVTNSDGSVTYYSETTEEGKTEIWKIINLTADAHPIHLHLVQFQLLSRQNFNVSKYNKAYNALFPPSAAIDPMTGLPYPGGVFIGGYGPPKGYDFYYNPQNNAGWLGGNPDITPYLQGPAMPANPNERGWKDTFIMYPGQVTTIIARWAPTDKPADADASTLWFPFDPNGGHGYVWHCHIIDHEDNEMMRPYNVNPNPAGPWASAGITRTSGTGSKAMKAASSLDTSEKLSEMINGVELEQNYPNPFSGQTEIRFTLPEPAHVRMILFNAQGAQVQTLIDADAPAGLNTVRLDAGNLKGGTYFYQLSIGNIVRTKKMVKTD